MEKGGNLWHGECMRSTECLLVINSPFVGCPLIFGLGFLVNPPALNNMRKIARIMRKNSQYPWKLANYDVFVRTCIYIVH